MMDRTRLTQLVVLVVSVAAMTMSGAVVLAEDTPAPRGTAIDHPISLVAFASVDRLLSRAASLGDALGIPDQGEKLLAGLVGGDDVIGKLLTSPGLDTTRPLGAVSYPKWMTDRGDPGSAN